MTRLLDELVSELVRDHPRRTTTVEGDVYGTEPGLLVTLAGAVENGGERSRAGGGGTVAGAPCDLTALALLEDITRVVDNGWTYAGDPSMVRVPVTAKLNAWAANTTEVMAEASLTAWCQQWVGQIRDYLEPKVRLTLDGDCPACGNTHVRVEQDGETVYRAALTAYETHAECAACLTQWHGGEMFTLSDHVNRHAQVVTVQHTTTP